MIRKSTWGLGGLLLLSALVGLGYHLSQPVAKAAVVATELVQASSVRPPSTTSAAPTGTRAPAFQVASLNAGAVRVPSARPTVVYFMSAGCGSCISGEQQLAQVAAHLPASVLWLTLDVEPGYDTAKAVLSMAQGVGAYWPQAFASNAILQAYHVNQLDMVAVIGKNGALLYDGPLPSTAQLDALIQQAEA